MVPLQQFIHVVLDRALADGCAVHIVADNSTKQTAEHHRHSTKAIVGRPLMLGCSRA
jgi:hypothetical protein